MGLSAEVASDDRVRGLSLSDSDAVASLNITYDAHTGVYAGLSALAVWREGEGPRPLGYTADIGYARRLGGGSWDIGVSDSEVDLTLDKRYAANYTEVYAGYSRDDLSFHLYYSPNYLTSGSSTLYAEANAAWRPARHWRLTGHVGVLTPLGLCERAAWGGHCERVDVRGGVTREFSQLELGLAVTALDHRATYPRGYRQAPDTVVLSAAWFF